LEIKNFHVILHRGIVFTTWKIAAKLIIFSDLPVENMLFFLAFLSPFLAD
jgi:hypothetical protein